MLEKGHTLHLDLGIKQDDYCSDIQRMWYVLDDGETAVSDEVMPVSAKPQLIEFYADW